MTTAGTEALFYHLSRQPLEAALVELLQRSLERSWRLTVRVGNPERVGALSDHLWRYRDEAFLPHGTADEAFPARQPIYLTAGEEVPNGPDVLMLVDRAPVTDAELSAFRRLVVLFDDADPPAVEEARTLWRRVTAADLPAQYWAQDQRGKWIKKAVSAGG